MVKDSNNSLVVVETDIDSDPRVTRIENSMTLEVGSYWRSIKPFDDDEEAVADRVLVLSDVKEVNGVVHQVELITHPSEWYRPDGHGTYQILLKDFLDCFVFEPDGERVRAEELAAATQKVHDQQQRLEMLRIELAETTHDEPETGRPDADRRLPALVNNRKSLTKAAAALSQQAETVEEAIQAMMPFIQEKALIAGLKAKLIQKDVERLQEGIETIGLYTGESVDVLPLATGSSADDSLPIFLFQRKLYVDEESLIHVAKGGADFRDLEEFGELLQNDPAVLERIAPSPRCVVSMQFRYEDKYYNEHPILNAMMNVENKCAFLLIRNGENVHAIFSSIESMERLFPTSDEFDQPFTGLDGSRITLDDLAYVGAHEKAESLELHYKRVLVLLWGLYDRCGEEVIGRFSLEAELGHLNLLSPDIQAKCFRFVTDDENLIGDGRPKFQDWVNTHNATIQSGSRVLCDWRKLIDEETAPGCYSRHIYHKAQRCYMPDDDWNVAIVYRRGTKFYVDGLVSGWAPHGRSERSFTAKIEVRRDRSHGVPLLCLDSVKPEDIDYYLENRETRRSYLQYAELLMTAHHYLEKEGSTEDSMRQELRKALVEGRVVDTEKEAISAVDDGIRQWRARHRGRALPKRGDSKFNSVYETLLHWVWAAKNHGRDRYQEMSDMLEPEGRNLLSVRLLGTRKLRVLATVNEDEIDARLGEHGLVQRIEVVEQKTQCRFEKRCLLMPTTDRPEEVAVEGPSAEYRRFASGRLFLSSSDTAFLLENLELAWDAAETAIESKSKKALKRLMLPVGLYRESDFGRIEMVFGHIEKKKVKFVTVSLSELIRGDWNTRNPSHMGYWETQKTFASVLDQLRNGCKGSWRSRTAHQSFEVGFAISEQWAAELDEAFKRIL